MKKMALSLALICWLWLLASQAQNLSLMVPTGHSSTPSTFNLSPDGKYLASYGGDTAILWEVETGRQLRVWADVVFRPLHFLPDSQSFIGPKEGDRTRRLIYDLPTMQIRSGDFPAFDDIIFAKSGGHYVARNSNHDLRIAQVNNAQSPIKLKLSGEKQRYLSSVFAASPNFKYIAYDGVQRVVDIWRFDPNAGQSELSPIVSLSGFTNNLRSAVFAPNDETILVTQVGRMVCYSITQRTELWANDFDANYTMFSPDGKQVFAVQPKGGIIAFDAATGEQLGSIYKPEDEIYAFQMVAPNRALHIKRDGEMLLLNFPQFQVVQRFAGRVDVTPGLLPITGKNQIWAGGNKEQSRRWDFEAGQLAQTGAPFGGNARLLPQKNAILTNNENRFELLNLTDQSRKQFPALEKIYTLKKFVVAPDEKRLLAWSTYGEFALYDLERDVLVKTFKRLGSQEISSVAFSPNSQSFAVSSSKGNLVTIFQSTDATEIKSFPLNKAYEVTYAPDGRLIVVADGQFQVFDQGFQLLKSFAYPEGAIPNNFQWLPDGKRAVAERSTWRNNIFLVDFEKGENVRLFSGNANFVEALAVLADGKHFVSSSSDNNTFLWDINSPTPLCRLFSFKNSSDWVAVTLDGRFDGSQGGIERLYFVNGVQTMALSALYEKFYTPNLLPRLMRGEISPAPNGGEDELKKLKAPPIVKISPPSGLRNLVVENDTAAIRRFTATAEKISLTVEASCANDVVTEIRLFHNGKLVGSGTRNLTVADDTPAAKKSQTYEIQLSPGDNHFRAIALNSQRTESRPDEIIVSYKATVAAAPPATMASLHLIVVGINQYKNAKYNLNYATADATAFKTAVEGASAGLYAKVNSVYIGDDQATREGLIAALEKVKATAQPQDVLIFYYAGHGVINEQKEFHLVPHDVVQLYGADEALAQRGLSASLMQQYSKDIKAQKQLFILDACQSAGALNQVAARGAAEEKAIAQLARATGTHWLTASGSEQFAAEFKQLGHGTFTYVLLEALSGKADKGGDRRVTVKELDAYLQEVVPELTTKYRGTPQYPASYGFGNDFPIGVVNK